MASGFPKKIFVTRSEDDDSMLYIDLDASELAEQEDENTEVAVYQLVKVGLVKKTSKIVFE